MCNRHVKSMKLRRFIAIFFCASCVPVFLLFGLIEKYHVQTKQTSYTYGPKNLHLAVKRRRSVEGVDPGIRAAQGNSGRLHTRGKRYSLGDLKKIYRHQTKKCPFRKQFNISETPLPKTALTSFPGSGNTWLRHLLQQATGLYTGSIYCDEFLKRAGLGECLANMTDRVIAEKIHEPGYDAYDRVILLVRNPFDAVHSFFNYKFAGHRKTVDSVSFKSKVWTSHVNESVKEWRASIEGWLQHFSNEKLHLVTYDDLQHNTVGEIQDILHFLHMPVTTHILWCTYLNRHGSFRRLDRKEMSLDYLYSTSAKAMISLEYSKVIKLLKHRFPEKEFTAFEMGQIRK